MTGPIRDKAWTKSSRGCSSKGRYVGIDAVTLIDFYRLRKKVHDYTVTYFAWNQMVVSHHVPQALLPSFRLERVFNRSPKIHLGIPAASLSFRQNAFSHSKKKICQNHVHRQCENACSSCHLSNGLCLSVRIKFCVLSLFLRTRERSISRS